MLLQANEVRQICRVHPLFEKGENEPAFARFEIIVRILDAFGNAFERKRLAEIILGEER